MAKISVVTVDGDVLPVREANYFDIGDASGDIDGGDFWSYVQSEHPGIVVKELRIILSEREYVLVGKDEDTPDTDVYTHDARED